MRMVCVEASQVTIKERKCARSGCAARFSRRRQVRMEIAALLVGAAIDLEMRGFFAALKNDKRKGKDSRFPSGMTSEKGKDKSRFPFGNDNQDRGRV